MEPAASAPRTIYKHGRATRVWHWVNALTIIVMLMSGLMIFNAHPRLYWGHYGANSDRAWLMIGATPTTGFLEIGGARLNTTGVLGRWTDESGVERTRAFPGWATIPSDYSLALGRRWHLAFALILAFGLLGYMLASLANRHVQRDLTIRRAELTPGHLWHDVKEHLALRFHDPAMPGAYNILQKLSYIGVIFVALPLIIFTGLAMSPQMDAAWPWLLDLFGGRQSARSIHFIAAALIVLFIVVHLVLVLLSGPVNGVRAMITGRLRVPAGETR